MKSLTRRHFMKTCMSSIASASIFSSIRLFSKDRHSGSVLPNLVIIVAADLGWSDVGYHGSEIETPNIDKLVSEGIELDRFYAFPLCSPTRVSLMTGRSPVRLGMTNIIMDGMAGPELDEHFLPETFKAAGYQTWMTGKWHLGDFSDYLPNKRGFDHFYGHLGGFLDYNTHKIGRKLDWQRNGEDVVESGYTTYLLRDEAINLIKSRDQEKPFLLYCSFNAPHTPLIAPDDLLDKYGWIDDENRRSYAAMVDAMDASIGQIISSLEDEGIRDNTLILFFSDNGANSGDGGGNNDPLRGAKATVFEGGIRTPACINWPGVLPQNLKCQQVISAMDILPTVSAALNIDVNNVKPLDGLNRWGQIMGNEADITPDSLVIIGPDPASKAAVLHDEWKLVEDRQNIELFKINEDPTESVDISNENPEIVQQLSNIIQEMKNTSAVVEKKDELPEQFHISQNYPNPFNPTTTIKYSLHSAQHVKITVFNVNGKLVSELLNQNMTAGTHTVNFDGSNLSSGVYFYKITVGECTQMRKMLLTK